MNNDKILDDLKEDDLPIFKTTKELANMTVETFAVPQNSTVEIQKRFLLPREHQSRAVGKLVDSRPDWLDLEEEEQLTEIKMKLILETVAQYLYSNDFIREECTMYDNCFDKEGNIILNAFYVKETKQGKALQQSIKDKQKKNKKKVTSIAQYRKQKESK